MTTSTKLCRLIQTALIDSDFIQRHRRFSTAFTRARKLSFGKIVATILHLARRSLQIECNLLSERTNMDEAVSKQAFSQARYKISYTGFKALHEMTLVELYKTDSRGLWRGFRLLGIDGSTIRLPLSEELEEYFERFDCGANQNESPIIARISEVVELTTGVVVSAEIAPWSFGERSLATEQINQVSNLFAKVGQGKQLYVFDRGYISKALMQQLRDKHADFLFRMPKGFNKAIDDLFLKNNIDVLVRLNDELEEVRVITRKLSSGETCVLMTSIIDAEKAPSEELFQIYWLRWKGCEEGYKLQKVTLELENFTGKGLEAVLQEFWAMIVIVNLLQVHCLDEEGPWNIASPPATRINRSVVFGSLRESAFCMIFGEISAEEFQKKFQSLARRFQVKIRPDRNYSRAKIGKPKRYHVYRRVC